MNNRLEEINKKTKEDVENKLEEMLTIIPPAANVEEKGVKLKQKLANMIGLLTKLKPVTTITMHIKKLESIFQMIQIFDNKAMKIRDAKW